MYRSVTFSEIFSSTFSDDLNRSDDSYDNNVKAKFVAKIGIGLIEFMLSSIFLCYGIIFSECVNAQYYTAEDGLWTTILFISMWNITGPWSRYICKYFERNRYIVFRYIIGISTIFLFIGFVLPGPNLMLSFGIFGGVFSNLIYTQLKETAINKFDMDSKVFEGNVQVARALTLLIMPHFTLLLVSYYTIYQMKLLIAAFLLNIFPIALIIKPEDDKQKYAEISRYQTLPGFSNQVREMMSFSNSMNLSDPHKSETTSNEEEEDQDGKEVIVSTVVDDLSSCDNSFVNEQVFQPAYLTPLTVETYYKNAGVSILPQIPEEREIEIEDNETDAIQSEEYIKVITKLKEISYQPEIAQQSQNDENIIADIHTNELYIETGKEIMGIKDLVSNKYLNGPEKIQNIEYIQSYPTNNKGFLKEFKSIKKDFCCCSSYRKFVWRRRFRSISDFFLDNIFKPFSVTVKDMHFYPTIITKVTTSVTSTIYITLAPYIASQKNKDFQSEDATFLLSYIAFSWCLFLVLLPLIINFSHGKIRITFICGLLLTGTSMTLVSRKMTNDVITISCLLFGFGYGAISFTENFVYKSFIGLRKWTIIKGSLETTSALFVILTYYIIYHFKLNLRTILFAAIMSHYLNAFLWIVAPVFKKIIIILNKYIRRRTQKHTFLQSEQYY